jgi:hypothetical protein
MYNTVVKILFGWIFKYCISGFMLLTCADHSQQFSAPFKAGNSRQVQTCYISQEYDKKNYNIIVGSYQLRRNGSSHDLEPHSVDVMLLAALTQYKLQCSAIVIQYHYHTTISMVLSFLSLGYSNRPDGSLPKLVHLRLRHKLVSLGN